MKKAPITSFRFWRDNKLTQEFTLTISELEEKFKQWLTTKDQAWINYYNTERAIRAFITDKEGLSSVHEESEFNDMYFPLKEIYIAAHVK